MSDKLGDLLGKSFQPGETLSPTDQSEILGKIEAAVREGKMRREDVEKVVKTIHLLGVISPELADNLSVELMNIAEQAQPGDAPIHPAGIQAKQIAFWVLLASIAAFIWYLASTSR